VYVVKVLKRKDASSVVVAVVLAMILGQAVQTFSDRPAAWLSGSSSLGGGWRAGLWAPLLTLVVELIVFELLIRAYVWLADMQAKK
jgi:hypothetical protein